MNIFGSDEVGIRNPKINLNIFRFKEGGKGRGAGKPTISGNDIGLIFLLNYNSRGAGPFSLQSIIRNFNK